jgi:hypothetical protein
MNFNDQLKQIIYWFGLGVGLVVYAHANFSTVKQVEKLESKIQGQASAQDLARIENKIDRILFHLVEK